MPTRALRSLALAVVLAAPAAAPADPRPLPMSQPYETLVEDKLELEQRVDAVPVRVAPAAVEGAPDPAYRLRAELATELRLGWSDRLELGLSVGVQQDAAPAPSLRLTGFSQRARVRLAEAGDWPVDVAVQVAITEHGDGIGAAERLIASWRRDAILVLANFEAEQRYGAASGEWEHAYQPSAGISVELSPHVSVGAEYWMRGRFDRPLAGPEAIDDPADPGSERFHYAGPAVLVQRGRLWLSAGADVRLDRLARSAPVDDRFGKLWVRALVGLEL